MTTPLTQAQACLEALETIADSKDAKVIVGGCPVINPDSYIAEECRDIAKDALPAAQALVDTLSKQGDEPKDKYDTLEWQIMACARNFRETDATPKEVGDALMQVIRRHYPTQQPTAIAEQREGLRSIREALDRGGFHATARGHAPDAMFIADSIALIDRMIGGE